jgi:hypothetical protein
MRKIQTTTREDAHDDRSSNVYRRINLGVPINYRASPSHLPTFAMD